MTLLMSRTLKTTLTADAFISSAAAALIALGAPMLHKLVGLPMNFMIAAGVSLIPFIAVLLWMIWQDRVARGLVVAIIALNFAWGGLSLFAAFGPLLAPTLLGKVFIIAQAVAVLIFAAFQMMGLKRSPAAA